jgi:hypothetical protein
MNQRQKDPSSGWVMSFRTKRTMLIVHSLVLTAMFWIHVTEAWTVSPHRAIQGPASGSAIPYSTSFLSTTTSSGSATTRTCRRNVLFQMVQVVTASGMTMAAIAARPLPSLAYTPDPDKLQESLYLISRVQEATVQQERFVNNSQLQLELRNKMKLTLKLVEKNYLLVDQINYCSAFVQPADRLVEAVQAGNIAVDALDSAIDYVKSNELAGTGPLRDDQKQFLSTALQDTRENLFVFLQYMPLAKVQAARRRIEEENVLNREEFSGDANAGVFNPVVLPWKTRELQQQLQQQ